MGYRMPYSLGADGGIGNVRERFRDVGILRAPIPAQEPFPIFQRY
jgi:hypothetical protein